MNEQPIRRDDLGNMTADEIVAAKAAGQLDAMLAGHSDPADLDATPRPKGSPGSIDAGVRTPPEERGHRLSRSDLHGMSPDAILAARAQGRLDHLLGGGS